MSRMKADEHTHDDYRAPLCPQGMECPIYPRIVNVEIRSTGSASYSHVKDEEDMIARLLTEAHAFLTLLDVWTEEPGDDGHRHNGQIRSTEESLRVAMTLLLPRLYPDAESVPPSLHQADARRKEAQ